MKIANNRALAAEKKAYEMPSVIMTQLVPSTIVLAGSPGGTIQNSGNGTSTIPSGSDPIVGG